MKARRPNGNGLVKIIVQEIGRGGACEWRVKVGKELIDAGQRVDIAAGFDAAFEALVRYAVERAREGR